MRMQKSKAIEVLGGSIASAAEALGITYQAVDKWPEMLPGRIDDRVIAALVRKGKKVPAELLVREAKATA
ncbi:hypothetical protein [Variovorax boronicumulans]|uniref:hypothetical protein n=1 Tax=Variovorax boronicumulans TaxID=436515 RepID=UPI00214C70AB